MPVHNYHVPADAKDRKKFAKDWKAGQDFKEKEKTRRFAEIDGRKKKKKKKSPYGSGGINLEVKGD